MNKKKFAVHFVGIKGVGMTPLAIIAKEAGFAVSGSDTAEEFITDAALKKAGIVPFVGFSEAHVRQHDLVITTGAHGGFDNAEVKAAKQKGIQVITAGDAVGLFMKGEIFGRHFEGISVAGSHGKTTTTAMIATILREAGLDPSFVIGTGDVRSLGAPGHLGRGSFFVAEADEYANEPRYDKTARFLKQHPKYIVFTNIEFDHPDIYPTIDAIRETFLQFANSLPKDGILIACGDDREITKMGRDLRSHVSTKTYGFHANNEYVLKRVGVSGEQTFFWVESNGFDLGQFVLRVPGEHNALNALAASIVCIEAGVSLETTKKGLLAFRGSRRRLEATGALTSGAKAYDDYAHHPTEIATTLGALKKHYPTKRIVCIFQPHTYTRTKALFSEFLRVFRLADTVLVMDIFASAREQVDLTVSSALLVQSMKSTHKKAIHTPHFTDVIEYINQAHYGSDTVIVTMGAGDVYKIHNLLGVREFMYE